ncbi:hypothetical protein M2451_003688 [Dysgonomonas sp. PFB1-18]|nr:MULTISPECIES: hypothetical protein [unclassified Dysgonomonas]MDH6310877.1 hypothetical protein [Dysgonomonas sp. PF1-14]MDH6340685.1 hypothetical protein [Dysgonomonas sp. PF1-16]MDH6382347.1 hypothetical protein [Dysgonomonas sp. PFB1-18]MDH6399697.1 hypothetical protein [Dysgonomonas sp. PF1-23]
MAFALYELIAKLKHVFVLRLSFPTGTPSIKLTARAKARSGDDK